MQTGASDVKLEAVKEEGSLKAEGEGVKTEVGGGDVEAGAGEQEGEGSPDSGASGDGTARLDLKGKTDAAKIEQLQKVISGLVNLH